MHSSSHPHSRSHFELSYKQCNIFICKIGSGGKVSELELRCVPFRISDETSATDVLHGFAQYIPADGDYSKMNPGPLNPTCLQFNIRCDSVR
jgi:hypothetical protein